MSIQSYTRDPIFIETAHKLGYTSEDLQQITIENIEQSSKKATKNMAQQQRNHYIYKKYIAMQERQSKIINKIKQQMAKSSQRIDKNRKGFNPIIKKLLDDHQMRLQKKERYKEKRRISKTRDAETRKINNTIDFGRTSPNFSHTDNNSRVSNKTMKSQNSKNSRNSSRSNQSHKSRLELVRLRQKQQQKFKKNILKHNQRQLRKRVNKVQQDRLSLSRRLKTKSQISQQAVQQKKHELQNIKNDQIRNHIEKLKYKMLKNDYLRKKQEQKKLNQSIPFDGLYKKQLKNLFQQNQLKMNKTRYQQKIKAVQRKKKEIQMEKRIQTESKLRDKRKKQLYVQKYREHIKAEQEQIRKQTLQFEYTDLQRAKMKKQKIQSDKKMKLIENKVKQEIVRSNYHSIENRRRLDSQSKVRQLNERMREINDIQNIKRTLTRERKGNGFNRLSDQDQNILFY